MRIRIILFILLIGRFTSLAQVNDLCSNPTKLNNLNNYCSPAHSYSNVGATDDGYSPPGCWSSSTIHDVWFSFVVTAYDVNISVNGNTGGLGTLNYPQVALYSGTCGGTLNELGCKSGAASGANTVSLYKGGLTIGQTYLIRVDGAYSYTGTFNLCINNFVPPTNLSGDCGTAAKLCNKNTVTVPVVSGPGNNPNEGYGTCLDLGFGNVESNSTWFTWTVQNSGTLDFTITPLTPTDDIDFVLYQLNGGCSNKTVIRCNASSCMGPNGLGLTGLGTAGTNTTEGPGCGGSGGNGTNSYSTTVNLTSGVTYALLINNWTSANNGFTLSFGGTSTFQGPSASFTYVAASGPCGLAPGTPITFTNTSSGASANNWTFGSNASTPTYNGVTPPVITYSTPGTYTVTLEVQSAQGCKVIYSQNIIIGAGPPAPAVVSPTYCQGATAAPLSATGTGLLWYTSSTGGLGSATAPTPSTGSAGATVYYVSQTVGGCESARSSITVTVTASPTVSIAPQSICTGQSVALTANPSVPVSNYSWSPALGLNNTTISNPVASPATTTNYSVTVTDGNGCSGTGSALVTVNPLPVISVSPGVGICTGMNTQITSSGGTTYLWTPSAGLNDPNISNPTATPAATTTYSVLVTDVNGCTGTAATTVTINPFIVLSTSPDTAICTGSQAQLNVTGPNATTYTWTPALNLSNTTIADPVANPSTTTTYSVTVNNSFGCSGSASVTVTVNPLPVITVSPPAGVCVGGSTQLSAGGGAQYSWSPSTGLNNANVFDPMATPATATTYSVTVVDGNGCVNTNSTSVTINPPPVISVSPPMGICTGMSIQITSSGGTAYSWSPSVGLNDPTISNPTATPATTTTYSLTATDANGCTNTASTTITVNNYISLTISPNASICTGAQTQLNVTGPNATTYTWTPALGLNDPTIANPIASPSATTTYSVDVTNSFGCNGNATVTVTVNPLPLVTITPPANVCVGGSIQLTAGGGNQYSWSPSAGLSNPNIYNPVATPASVATYSVTVTDLNGCVNTAATTITPTPIVVNVIPNQAICIGANIQLTAGGGATYSWSPATGLNNPNIGNPIASPAATTNYTVYVTTAAGCIGNGMVTVLVNPPPVVYVGSSYPSTCSGTSVQLTASGGAQYSWSPAIGLSNPNISNPLALPGATTSYSVIITDSNGCTNQASTTIAVVAGPIANAGPDRSICAGETVQLNVTGGATYSWMPSPSLSSLTIPNPVATPLGTSFYVVEVSNGNGCPPVRDTVVVIVHSTPAVHAGTDTSIMAGSSVTLSATGSGGTYQWNPSDMLSCTSCANTVASPLQTTTYIVTTSDIFGCRNSDTVVVGVDDVLTLFVPSAFTPYNYDVNNDIFYASGIGIHQFEFYVFDRWGTMIFESKDPRVGWDGSFRGQMVQQDVYVFLAKATSITGKSITKTGSVTVAR